MDPVKTAVCRFQRNTGTVQKTVALARAFAHLPGNAKVVIKPNIVARLNGPFPKWGVITTSTIMEETVVLLKDYGINDISIVEGSLQMTPKDTHIGQNAFAGLGYQTLKQRYGVKLLDVWERPFDTVDIGDGMTLKVNTDLMASDFLVNLPVLKTHAQVRVSLGIKNLKGFLNVSSRNLRFLIRTFYRSSFRGRRNLMPPRVPNRSTLYPLVRIFEILPGRTWRNGPTSVWSGGCFRRPCIQAHPRNR